MEAGYTAAPIHRDSDPVGWLGWHVVRTPNRRFPFSSSLCSQLVQKMDQMQAKIMEAPPMKRCRRSDRPDSTGMAEVQQIMLARRKSCGAGQEGGGRKLDGDHPHMCGGAEGT